MSRLLVPTDFSERSRVALTQAIDLARRLGASIELVHIHETPVYPAPEIAAVTPLPPDILAGIEAELAKEAERVRAAGIKCEAVAVWGDPRKEIARRAGDCELIVMGTHGRSGLSHALLGSVTEATVRKATCPVVVVPPPERLAAKPRE